MRFRIHPGIGIARVGNSEDYYLAPETAGGLPLLPEGDEFQPSHFRDEKERLRRQAVRFQVFDYERGGSPVVPGKNGVKSIRWTVHVANKKASWYEFRENAGENGYAPDHPLRNAGQKDRLALIIDPGPRTLEGPNQHAEFDRNTGGKYQARFPRQLLYPGPRRIESLGAISTDKASRLIFVGGYGISGSETKDAEPANFVNNDGWWDDTSDGPVTAKVIMEYERESEYALPAWVTVAPPRYAPQLLSLVTLYDVIFDTSVRFMRYRPEIFKDGMWTADYRPSWVDHIRPILERAHLYHWVVAIPPKPHEFDWERLGNPNKALNAYRKYYLDQVRSPDQSNQLVSTTNGLPLMPYIAGDNCLRPEFPTSNYLTLTRTQYFFLMQWARGNFTRDPEPELSEGLRLDKAALENCSGGAFSPGIEMGWIARNPRLYDKPFRIRVKSRDDDASLTTGSDLEAGLEAGDISKYQAVPWQADFNDCSFQSIKDPKLGARYLWWWPVQRPTYVHTGNGKQAAWVGTSSDQTAGDYLSFAKHLDMVEKWSQLGFVFNEGTPDRPRFLQVNRTLCEGR